MGQDAMSYGDEVEAIALPHLPTMDFPGPKCCHPRAPRMTLVRHANCQACPSEPPDDLLTFTRTSGYVAAEIHLKPAEDLRGRLKNLNNCSLRSELAPTVESIM